MKKRVAFITGAASGIGLAISRELAEKGATVFISDMDAEKIKLVSAELKAEGLEVHDIACDVTDEDALKSAIDSAFKPYGRLDILINNAGLQYLSPIEDFPSAQFEFMLKVMLTAPFYAIKHVFPLMKAQNYGRIINMASVNGLVGFAGKAAYNSAKHGLIGLTKVAALEGAAFGITVNAICPGYVDTPLVQNQLAAIAEQRGVHLSNVLEDIIYPLVPQRRLLSVKEVAAYVSFLAGEDTVGVTGQAIVIDGGYTAQ
jgi:3-hydroxybutyrate dehydrogenase